MMRNWIQTSEGEPQERISAVLQIATRISGDVTIVNLQGKAIIGPNTDLLSRHLRKLAANGVRKLLLNLADLEQVDSSGIAAILGTYASLLREGGSLKLLRPTDRVREVLVVMRLLNIIPTFEDEVEALASFRPLNYSAGS
jgi:anti-sigma B factor antagonist